MELDAIELVLEEDEEMVGEKEGGVGGGIDDEVGIV